MSKTFDESGFDSGISPPDLPEVKATVSEQPIEECNVYYQFREVGQFASRHWTKWNFCSLDSYHYYKSYPNARSGAIVEVRVLKPLQIN